MIALNMGQWFEAFNPPGRIWYLLIYVDSIASFRVPFVQLL